MVGLSIFLFNPSLGTPKPCLLVAALVYLSCVGHGLRVQQVHVDPCDKPQHSQYFADLNPLQLEERDKASSLLKLFAVLLLPHRLPVAFGAFGEPVHSARNNLKMSESDIKGVVIITGAAQGIGAATAKLFAERHKELHVILAIRQPKDDEDRPSRIAKQLALDTDHPHISGEGVDLSDFSSVVAFRNRVLAHGLPVNAVLNVAGECPRRRETRHNGVEAQFGSNVLGYHFMMKAFCEPLAEAAGRIVNVASDWAGDLDLSDLQFENRAYDNDIAYRQSKQCNRMLTVTWSEKLAKFGILVNGCHPGDPCTTLSCALGYNTCASRDCSVCTCPYLLATAPGLKTTGGWFDQECRPRTCRYASDKYTEQRQKLFEECESYCQ